MVNNSKQCNKNFLFNRSEKTSGPFNVGREIQYLPDPQQQEAMDEYSDDCDDGVSDLFKAKLEIREKNKKKKSLPGDKILKKIREDMFKKQQHQLKIQKNISKAVSSVIRSKI